MRARYYDLTVGRFISEDPLGLDAGVNLYAYALNNPINWIDPSGLLSIVGGGSVSLVASGDPEAPKSGWRSNEATVGIVINPGVGESHADLGMFGALGRGGGFNVGADLFVGLIKGQSVEGHTVNLNFVVGPVRATVVLDDIGRSFQGVIVGVGPTIPIGFSATESITGDVTARGLVDDFFDKRENALGNNK